MRGDDPYLIRFNVFPVRGGLSNLVLAVVSLAGFNLGARAQIRRNLHGILLSVFLDADLVRRFAHRNDRYRTQLRVGSGRSGKTLRRSQY